MDVVLSTSFLVVPSECLMCCTISFESVNEIGLTCNHSNESYRAMFSCGAVIYVDRILKYAIRMKRIEFNSALVSDPLFTKCTYSVLLGNILVRV